MLDAVIQLSYETEAKLVNANDVYYYVYNICIYEKNT